MVVKKKKFQSGFSPKTKSQPPAAAPSVYTALKTSIQDAPREKIFPLKKKKKPFLLLPLQLSQLIRRITT